MKQMELFAGIGGFGLAGEWAGIESAVQVEWNPFCQKVLAKNFPNAQRYGDITKFDGTPFRGAIDIISGGFPCQPYSTAGKRLGKEDERHLWPEMLRVIREVAPRWVVGENVRGIVSWNGGMVFDEVQSDLEAAGYEVQAFILPACAVDAPHRRDRVWFIAFNSECQTDGGYNRGEGNRKGMDLGWDFMVQAGREQSSNNTQPSIKNAPNAKFNGLSSGVLKCGNKRQELASEMGFRNNGHSIGNAWDSPPELLLLDDGLSEKLDEPAIAALGNAIVPQVAFQIFKAIMQYEAQAQPAS